MRSKVRGVTVLLGTVALCGCDAVSSRDVQLMTAADRGRAAGQVYSLPRLVVTAQLLLNREAGLSVSLSSPTLIADTGRGMLDGSRLTAAERGACGEAAAQPRATT
ncbi:hypothetical protein J4558_23995 [Leptolyngbya sp. 15MV]|nr:hypothetical protein J4558_23995 [Leptolyngbya sp. 15MV]